MMHNRKLLEQALVALKVSTTPLPEDRQTVLAAVSAIQEQDERNRQLVKRLKNENIGVVE